MPFTKEQQQEYYQKNKAKLNQQRAERRKHTEVETKVNEVAQPEKKVETTEIKKEVETEVKPVTPEVSSEKVPKTKPNFCPPYNFPIPKSSLGGQDKFGVKKSENGKNYSPNSQRIRENNKKEKEKKKSWSSSLIPTQSQTELAQQTNNQMNVLETNSENNILVEERGLKSDKDRKDYLNKYYQDRKEELKRKRKERYLLNKNQARSVEQNVVEQSRDDVEQISPVEQLKVSHAEQNVEQTFKVEQSPKPVEQKIEPETANPERKWSFETMLEKLGADPNHFTPE
ncbi:5519_t:CDS:2 [Gigaspora margarita]|uniref:5519_t:CDS:1 n=1 Tax=Gigaspora margarita TaxID=4874 RepID=A0ABN7UG39_GIGMA|nr:5519_t:CDS:2 [Gigaspora margarita]